MHRRLRLLAAAGLLFALSFGVSSSARVQELSADAERVVAYLLDDWAKQFRSTSIPLAMDNLDMEPDDGLRLQIGQHFREHAELARNLRFWGANNYILTNEEKRIAKFLIQTYEKQGRMSQHSEAARALEISPEHLRGRLAFMAQAGLLQRDSGQELGFALIAEYEPWGGPLRHNFHTVRVEGEKPFDVW